MFLRGTVNAVAGHMWHIVGPHWLKHSRPLDWQFLRIKKFEFCAFAYLKNDLKQRRRLLFVADVTNTILRLINLTMQLIPE